jgi:4-aminobutyrate aminotransferase
LLVLDEVQSGFGRTGKLFASEHWGVEGDIVCLAKGIASGLPLGAIVARDKVMDWPSGSHASTFGGNPVACAAAIASLRLIRRKYMGNAVDRGFQLRKGLEQLADRFSIVREVRGLGLMIGLEIREESGGPAPLLRDRIIDLAFHRGLLLLPCGASTIRFCPPLCLTARQVEIGLRLLEAAMEEAVADSRTLRRSPLSPSPA